MPSAAQHKRSIGRGAADTVGVIDYRAGNAPSVIYALERLGIAARLVRRAADLKAVGRIVLPGVGSAPATMRSLEEQGLLAALETRVLDEAAPFLGICVGMQILFEHSAEGNQPCLGWLPGEVSKFPPTVRVPQMGWNAVEFVRSHPIQDTTPSPAEVYFVNSYYARPAQNDDVLGVTDYGVRFCSVVARDNVVGTQFHVEKSGPVGLSMLRAFCRPPHQLARR